MLSLNEALAQSKNNKHLLMGNGFSASVYDNFFYQSLKQVAEGIYNKKYPLAKNDFITDFFNDSNNDFELALAKIIQELYYSKIAQTTKFNLENILKLSIPDGLDSFIKPENYSKDDYIKLKELLVDAITSVHPDSPSSFFNNEFIIANSAYHFLNQFTSLYTFNYDLILYWLINIFSKEKKFFDGFTKDEWNGSNKQNVHFLHGAFHLLQGEENIKKLIYNGSSLHKQLSVNKELGDYPLFVSEGSSDKKLKTIQDNKYLNYCFENLSTMEGDLFIFGHSLATNDYHVFDKIFHNGKIINCYVGIYNNDSKTLVNFDALKNNYKNISFIAYNSAENDIWTNSSCEIYKQNNEESDIISIDGHVVEDRYEQKDILMKYVAPRGQLTIGLIPVEEPLKYYQIKTTIHPTIHTELRKQLDTDVNNGIITDGTYLIVNLESILEKDSQSHYLETYKIAPGEQANLFIKAQIGIQKWM